MSLVTCHIKFCKLSFPNKIKLEHKRASHLLIVLFCYGIYPIFFSNKEVLTSCMYVICKKNIRDQQHYRYTLPFFFTDKLPPWFFQKSEKKRVSVALTLGKFAPDPSSLLPWLFLAHFQTYPPSLPGYVIYGRPHILVEKIYFFQNKWKNMLTSDGRNRKNIYGKQNKKMFFMNNVGVTKFTFISLIISRTNLDEVMPTSANVFESSFNFLAPFINLKTKKKQIPQKSNVSKFYWRY